MAATLSQIKLSTQTLSAPRILASPSPDLFTATASPTAFSSATPVFVFTPTVLRPFPSTRQVEIFEEVWGVVNENYLYPDFNGLNWGEVRQDMLQKISAGLSEDEFYDALAEMIFSLGDMHSTFFNPDMALQLDQEYAGNAQYVGIGVIHTPVPERKVLSIVYVYPNSPAAEAGLQPHDNILAVDGQPVFDEEGNRLNLLLGEEGTTVLVTIQTPGQTPRDVSITRRAVVTETPIPSHVVTTPGGKRIGYLMIPTFLEEQIDERVSQALQELSSSGPLDGLIIDNRNNGGGTIDVMLNTLAHFTTGPVGLFEERDVEETIEVNGLNIAGSQQLPLVVLVGKGSASFGEIFSGILRDLGRAKIIGEQTNGNVEMLRIFDFSDKSRAWIATATFRPLKNPDQNWEKTGIIPDISVLSDWDLVTDETDPVIIEALKVFEQ